MKIVNLTQHRATPDQIDAGVEDLYDALRAEILRLLTFEELSDLHNMENRARALADILWSRIGDSEMECGAMIGGAPYFMPVLERVLKASGVKVFYAFSKRDSVEDETGKKISVFSHKGFFEAK